VSVFEVLAEDGLRRIKGAAHDGGEEIGIRALCLG
jgi:hypothetical protein